MEKSRNSSANDDSDRSTDQPGLQGEGAPPMTSIAGPWRSAARRQKWMSCRRLTCRGQHQHTRRCKHLITVSGQPSADCRFRPATLSTPAGRVTTRSMLRIASLVPLSNRGRADTSLALGTSANRVGGQPAQALSLRLATLGAFNSPLGRTVGVAVAARRRPWWPGSETAGSLARHSHQPGLDLGPLPMVQRGEASAVRPLAITSS